MDIRSVPSLSTINTLTPAGSSPPAKIRKAAEDFEALMISQMLKSARESALGGGWGLTDPQHGENTALELADEQMAQVLARNGGLGLQKFISAGLQGKTAEPAIHSTNLIHQNRSHPK